MFVIVARILFGISTTIAVAMVGMLSFTALAHAESASGEFRFARLAYNTNQLASRNRRGASKWQTDWPEAEDHFLQGVNRLSHVDADVRGHVVTAQDDDLFDYPWIYAVEVGYWSLSEVEASRLREYLLRGGFLMVDDFHGSRQWSRFLASIVKVFPDRPILEIPEDDEVLHVLYDLDQRVQIPGVRMLYTGQTWEEDGYEPHWRGVYDDKGRLMVAINFNMDLGDAWEHADTPEYPEPMTALAYRFAVNYVIYAITH